MDERGGMHDSALDVILVVDAAVFLVAALLNFGLQIPLGVATLRFPVHIWQAGLGEAVIGLLLLGAAMTEERRLPWVAWGLSILGIIFGLSSRRVQGPARDIHIVLVPLTVIVGALLVWRHRHNARRLAEPVTLPR